jgi:hypothetical protein
MARSLEEFFERRVASLLVCPQGNDDEGESPVVESKSAQRRENAAPMTFEEYDTSTCMCTRVHWLHYRHSCPLASQGRPAPVTAWFRKRDLAQNLKLIGKRRLGRVLQIIHERDPTVLKQSTAAPDAEIEVDLDILEADVIRYVETFVTACLANKKQRTAHKLQQSSAKRSAP